MKACSWAEENNDENKEDIKKKKGGGGGDDHEHGHSHDAAGEAPNPHVWLDPVLACHGVSNIISALAEADPKHSAGYRKRGQEYIARLELLDREMRTAVQLLPHKAIVTFHDAFPYFARDFGLDIVGVIEREPGQEPSAKELAGTVDLVRAKNVKVILAEPQYSDKAAQTIARETGAKVYQFDPVATGPAEPPEARGAYLRAMDKNLEVLRTALP
jgi:zinc transport system substrate-binding protein